MNAALLEEACDVFFGAGGPSERRAVVHQLSGHDEWVPPFQLTVIPLTVVMNSKAAFKHNTTHYHIINTKANVSQDWMALSCWTCKFLVMHHNCLLVQSSELHYTLYLQYILWYLKSNGA